jgi:amino acid adenylation domain-containing protein
MLTYGELNRWVNRLARKMKAAYPGGKETTNQPVTALLFDHGIEPAAAVLAALEAGMIYVPFDSNYPEKRLAYMLRHSSARMIVTQFKNRELAKRLSNAVSVDKTIFTLVVDDDKKNQDEDDNYSERGNQVENRNAYLLYTSGSTGRPKAVLQTRENILYFIDRYRQILSITPGDRITLFSSFSHDASIMDIYGSLLNGAVLYPMDIRDQPDLSTLPRWLNRERITIWHSVPTFFRYFMSVLEEGEPVSFPHLRYIVLGGEAVRPGDIRRFSRLFPSSILYNLYGQTESTYNGGAFNPPGAKVKNVALGEAVEGTERLVLDEEGAASEELEIGEIYIASPHIAVGYWNDPEAAANAFLYTPGLGRVYRTGDLARIDYDGSIEFMGRKDSQVKIRGYRIEPAEVENRLLEHPAIKEVVVTGVEDKNQDRHLCAYVVPHASFSPTSSELRAYVSLSLPGYMVPAYFVMLDAIPVTPGGKTDRHALPEPKIERAERYIPPRNRVEETLTEIWSDILKIKKELISMDSNFFELGGHSLKAITLVSEIHKALDVRIHLRTFFANSTIESLARWVSGSPGDPYISIAPVEKREYYSLSPAQKRLYLLNQKNVKNTNYNMPLSILLRKVNKEKLETAFRKLIHRHETLRTSFELVNGESVQRVHDEVEFELENYKLQIPNKNQPATRNSQPVTSSIKSFIRPFDLSGPPLLRVGLTRLEKEKWLLLVDMHHIISDGVSLALLQKDFTALYEGEELPHLRLHYKDYSLWVDSKTRRDILKKQEAYWLGIFTGDIPVLNLPLDYPRPAVQSFEGSSLRFSLDREETLALRRLAAEEDVTLFLVLVTVFIVLLAKLGGQEDIVVGTGAAGRAHADLQHIIGMFVNTLPLRTQPAREKPFRIFLKEVKERTLEAFENQDYPYSRLVEKVLSTPDHSRNPLVDVIFVLQNEMESNTESREKNERDTGIEIIAPKENQYELEQRVSKFDLVLNGMEVGDTIAFRMEYCSRLFKKETIRQFFDYFREIVSIITAQKEIPLEDILFSNELAAIETTLLQDDASDFDF